MKRIEDRERQHHIPTTLQDHILQGKEKVPGARGRFTIVLSRIAEASQIIASHVKTSGLVQIEGETGATNVFGESVQKLDDFSNQILIGKLLGSGHVFMVGSEELEAPIVSEAESGEYDVFIDPLDGSSNIDINAPIGTIFSIYHYDGGRLKPGREQVAAGYVLYGSGVMFVYSTGETVDGFTYDPSTGFFYLTHPNLQVPHEKKEYSINEGNYASFDPGLQKYLDTLKEEGGYGLRYVASMVGDVHRILTRGGIFIYPSSKKTPSGKLRLVYEVNPLSWLIEIAGGKAYSNGSNPLDIVPAEYSHTVPIALGSTGEVEKLQRFMENE